MTGIFSSLSIWISITLFYDRLIIHCLIYERSFIVEECHVEPFITIRVWKSKITISIISYANTAWVKKSKVIAIINVVHRCNKNDSETQMAFFFFSCLFKNRRKYWLRDNFWLPVLDEFIRFGMFWTRFHNFWKMCVCLFVLDKNFVESIAEELMHRIS